jgi:hypothetical protein
MVVCWWYLHRMAFGLRSCVVCVVCCVQVAYVFQDDRYQGKVFKAQAQGVIDSVAQYFDVVQSLLATDGACNEGAAYWEYGLQFLVRYGELERWMRGRDLFSAVTHYRNTIKYRTHVIVPGTSPTHPPPHAFCLCVLTQRMVAQVTTSRW